VCGLNGDTLHEYPAVIAYKAVRGALIASTMQRRGSVATWLLRTIPSAQRARYTEKPAKVAWDIEFILFAIVLGARSVDRVHAFCAVRGCCGSQMLKAAVSIFRMSVGPRENRGACPNWRLLSVEYIAYAEDKKRTDL
jgi:hypothetical protein